MATDSTLEETDASPDDGRDEAGPRGTPSPPRPPRPGKRSKGSGRIPIPLPQSRPSLEAIDSDPLDRAPAVNIDERGEPAFPLRPARPKPATLPEESFADIDADLADHAPPAPVTPWRGMPSPSAAPTEATPPRGTPFMFQSDDEESASEPEPTLVGKVNENLLELAGAGGDENTRAFTAPRELIELARRKREERQGGRSDEFAPTTARNPGAASRHDASNPRAAEAPNLRDGERPSGSDAGPPVARGSAAGFDAASREPVDSHPLEPESGPEIEIDPASELSPSARRAVLASTGRNVPLDDVPAADTPLTEVSLSDPAAIAKKSSSRAWLISFGLFVLIGIIIARWRDMAALFR